MAQIHVVESQFESGIVITTDDGQVLEAVVSHLANGDTFSVATHNANGEDDSFELLYSCPVSRA